MFNMVLPPCICPKSIENSPRFSDFPFQLSLKQTILLLDANNFKIPTFKIYKHHTFMQNHPRLSTLFYEQGRLLYLIVNQVL